MARSANGDGFAVWMADDGGSSNGGTSQPLGQPLQRRYGRVGQPDQDRGEQRPIEEFDLAVDASGNTVVVWNEITVLLH